MNLNWKKTMQSKRERTMISKDCNQMNIFECIVLHAELHCTQD